MVTKFRGTIREVLCGGGAKFRNMGGAVLGGRDKISRSGRCQIGWWKAGTKTK